MKKSTSNGFNLLELMLVISVAALIILGGLFVYNLNLTNQRITESGSLLQTIISGTRKMYLGQTDYGAANITARLSNSGIISSRYPLTLAGANTSVRGPFGNVAVVGVTANFDIVMAGLPTAVCTKLAADFNTTNTTGITQVRVNGIVITAFAPDTLNTACNVNSNIIIWRSR